ncbi:hypothetical protein PRIPAC_86320 [Pristionchus pacificus]|uniref:EGF-like domain-containing protein n=1 Tax=Pristionchus pacificus TaxID=54126 RepID=A0A2A6BS38_PRIPA|nr:hypothetical protein PRIPAC_86320 [Pristionchus pacificus]|eukprot:PDM68613.1 hypothetical protein PRIPAC_46915 [Pristionchus pacificus]
MNQMGDTLRLPKPTDKKRKEIGDPCAEIPCLNGGRCASNGAVYTCQCTSDRFGPQCQCEHQSIPNPIPNSFSVSGDPCSDVTCAATGTCNTIFEVSLT